ncbi:UNVERIFIED_CONTAM: hypothetical protein Sindi_0382400 [Sesamum indicum]
MAQGNLSVSAYYAKLKRLWDELTCLKPLPQCECKVSKAFANLNLSTQLMQFLMGLHDNLDHVRSQILLMEPLPSVNKAYSMVLRVEKQREINTENAASVQNLAMQVKENRRNTPFVLRNIQRKKTLTEKQNMICQECGKTGHPKSTSFEIYGILTGTRPLW